MTGEFGRNVGMVDLAGTDAAGSGHLEPAAGRRTCVLVLGMHRSGTSALAGVLSLLGVTVPRSLMAPDPDNPRGYWESLPLYDFHERLLASVGSRWHDWTDFNPHWLASAQVDSYSAELRSIIESEYGSAPLFVVKDPRMCRILPLWMRVLKQAEIAPAVIIPYRNPIDVAMSLKRRDNIPLNESLLIWLRHVLDAEAGTRSLRRSLIDYDILVKDWRTTVDRIANDIGVSWPRPLTAVESAIDLFLSDELRHHHSDRKTLMSAPNVVEWAKDAFHALGLLAAAPAQASDALATLDRIGREFGVASRVFGSLMADRESEWRTTRAEQEAKFARRVRDLEEAVKTRATRVRDLEEAVETRATRVRDLEEAVETRATRVRDLEGAVKTCDSRIDEMRQVLSNAGRAVEAVWKERTEVLIRTQKTCSGEPPTQECEAREHWQCSAPSFVRTIVFPISINVIGAGGEGRTPNSQWLPMKSSREAVSFDREYYLRQSPRLRASGGDALLDYLEEGDRNGKKPHPLFEPRFYRRRNRRVLDDDVNSLFDYIKSGAKEERRPNRWFGRSGTSVSTPTPHRSASIHYSTMPKLASSQAINLARNLTLGGTETSTSCLGRLSPSNSIWMWARRSDWQRASHGTNECMLFPPK